MFKADWYKVGGAGLGAVAGFLLGGPVGLVIAGPLGYLIGGKVETAKGLQKDKGVVPGVSAFTPPVPKAGGTPVVSLPAIQAGPVDQQKTAAVAMNSALSSHGYKKADQALYMAFQRVVGLAADGYPGKGTMAKLQSVLTSAGVAMAPVTIYPFSSVGAYDGKNAPTVQEWSGQPDWSGPPPTITQADPAASAPTLSQVAGAMPVPANTPIVSVQDVQRALNTLGFASPPLVADGAAGALTKAAVVKFQTSKGLTADGIAGPQTKSALMAALSTQPSGERADFGIGVVIPSQYVPPHDPPPPSPDPGEDMS